MTLKINSKLINTLIDEEISRYWNIEPKSADINQLYRALSVVIRNMLRDKRNEFIGKAKKNEQKQVNYVCMEFLTGKSLRNNLYNLKIENVTAEAIKKYGVALEDQIGRAHV